VEAILKSENLQREALTLPPEIRSKLASRLISRLIESLGNDNELSPEVEIRDCEASQSDSGFQGTISRDRLSVGVACPMEFFGHE
jgi:hypothetical protein